MRQVLAYGQLFEIFYNAQRKAQKDFDKFGLESDRHLAEICKDLIDRINESKAYYFLLTEDNPF